MKIYDCFIFFNELDLLELRLRILDSVVDYFVIVEATKTKSGKPKQLNFKNNKKRFKKWDKKIIYVVVNDMPKIRPSISKIISLFPYGQRINYRLNLDSKLKMGRWISEWHQRGSIKRGLQNAKDEDIILVSDVDEIPNPKEFKRMKEILKDKPYVFFIQNMYYYYLNGIKDYKWVGTKACTYKNFKKLFDSHAEKFKRVRNIKIRFRRFFLKEKDSLIKNGGWHFSYLVTPEKMIEKMKSFCAIEVDKPQFKNISEIKKKIEMGKDLYDRPNEDVRYIPLDNSFPEEIKKNKKKYSKFIKEV